MVVGGRHRRHLRDAERLDLLGRRVRPLDRVGDRADGHDRALPGHQAGHRGDRAQAARVGERDVRALEVVGRELVLPRLVDQVLVAGVEAGEVEAVGGLDARHHEAARAVLALDVDGDPEVDGGAGDHERLAVALLERAGHDRPLGGRSDDRPGDQVRERDLDALLLELPVHRLPLGVEGVDGERAERGGRGGAAALVHRLREHGRGAAERLRLAGRRGRRGRRAVALGGQHVRLDDLAARARALDGAEVDAAVGRDPARDRGGLRAIRINSCRLLRFASGGSRARARLFGRSRTAGSRAHLGQRLPNLHHVIRLDEQLGDRARGRGRDLGVDLVGRDLDHRVALVDAVALGDMPLEHRPLGHGLAHLGHGNNQRFAGVAGPSRRRRRSGRRRCPPGRRRAAPPGPIRRCPRRPRRSPPPRRRGPRRSGRSRPAPGRR